MQLNSNIYVVFSTPSKATPWLATAVKALKSDGVCLEPTLDSWSSASVSKLEELSPYTSFVTCLCSVAKATVALKHDKDAGRAEAHRLHEMLESINKSRHLIKENSFFLKL